MRVRMRARETSLACIRNYVDNFQFGVKMNFFVYIRLVIFDAISLYSISPNHYFHINENALFLMFPMLVSMV